MELDIPLFDGIDFVTWRHKFTNFLKLRNCDENDDAILGYIYYAIPEELKDFISDMCNPHDIIKKLEDFYLGEPVSTGNIAEATQKFEKLKNQNFENLESFFVKFDKTVKEVQNSGLVVSEKQKLDCFLDALPQDYRYIQEIFKNVKKNDQSVEFIKKNLGLFECRAQEETTYPTPVDVNLSYHEDSKKSLNRRKKGKGKRGRQNFEEPQRPEKAGKFFAIEN